jgi:uncharacterized RmlC-like cupin family protein
MNKHASPEITNLNCTYKKSETEVWVLNADDIPVDRRLIKDQQIVYLAAKSVAGNHKHSRTEWFIGIGELEIAWLDSAGKKHKAHMNPNGQIRLIRVPSLCPHAVINKSQDKFGVIFEMADGKMKKREQVKVV